jgi:hypothetical protein
MAGKVIAWHVPAKPDHPADFAAHQPALNPRRDLLLLVRAMEQVG